MTIVYQGWRDHDGAHVRKLVDSKRRKLRLRLDLDNHSPDGFEWGYGGSGPAQLALALIADATGDDALARRLHQPFKWRLICPLHRDQPWQMTDEDVRGHVAAIAADQHHQES